MRFMNWKKVFGLLSLTMLWSYAAPRRAAADTYQLGVSSWVVNVVAVSSFAWTQVDAPQLSGRTSIEIYNMDTSSMVICRQDNLATTFGGIVSTNATAGLITGRPIPPSPTSAIAGSNEWALSLSNFSSSAGAYPVSATMPVYCVTAKNAASSNVAVTQSY